MKKTLLTVPSNSILLQNRSLLTVLFLVFSFWMGSMQTVTAQCVGPYKVFESFSPSPAGYTISGTPITFAVSSSNVRSGIYSFAHTATTNDAKVTTPIVSSVRTFSFYIRKTGPNAINFSLEFSDGGIFFMIPDGTNTTNGYNITANYPVIPISAGSGTWQEVSVTFNTPISNCQFRISDVRSTGTTGGIFLDDFSWTSTLDSENTILIPKLSDAAICPTILDVTRTYYFYDVGGNSDVYSGSQLNSISFTPSDTSYKIKATYEAFNTEATDDFLQLFTDNTYSTQIAGMNFSGANLPATYTSIDPNGALFYKFTTDVDARTAAQIGFRIKLECVGCAAPSSLAFSESGSVSHESAFLTWAGISSSYDIYHSTSNTAPDADTTPTATSTSTSATVTGLNASTQYYFWVRSDCGVGGKSSWTGPISSTTLCTPQTITYFENFNGLTGGVLPTCTAATASSWQSNSVNGNLFCNGVGQSFFTQGVTLTAGQLYRLTYDYASNGNGDASVEVFVGRPTNNTIATVSNINNSIAYNTNGSSVYLTNIVNFTASVSGTHYIRFFLDDLSPILGPTVLNLDNVKIELETCLSPTFAASSPVAPAVSGSPYVTAITASGATLAWNVPTTGVPSNGYFYFISSSSTAPGYNDSPTGTFASNSGLVLNTLSPQTRYYVWVRSNCGSQISSWSPTYATFVTGGSVSVPPIKISDSGSPYLINCNNNYIFTDSDGYLTVPGQYNNNENFTYTFKPDAAGIAAGAKLMVVFNTFSTEDNWDGLMIYSGLDTTSGILMSSGRAAGFAASCPAGAYSGSQSPGNILSIAADGSLTFQFRSDTSVRGSGWTASIVCITNVPTITSFTPTDNSCGTVNTVVISGNNFSGVTGTSGVTFNGIPAASYVVNSATQITATLPSGVTTGRIKVSAGFASGLSAVNFVVNNPPPTANSVVVCQGSSGSMTSSTSCDISGLTTFNGSLTTSSPIRPRPSFSGPTCGFTSGNYYFTSTQITVSVTGNYIFQTTSSPSVDLVAYITSGPFIPGNCDGGGTYILGNDDGAGNLQPLLNVNLTAGVVYTLFTTTYNALVITNYTWLVTPPVGGSISLYQSAQVDWYTEAIGGTAIGSGSSFNPIGVSGSPVLNNTTTGTWNFYAACSSNSTCRQLTTFTISPANAGVASSNQNICSAGSADPLILTGNAGSVIRWEYNATDSTFATGVTENIASSASNTLSAIQIGNFSGTRYFRAVVAVGSCTVYSNAVTISFSKTVWNGTSWSNGEPDSTKGAEFAGNFVSSVNTADGNLTACSVLITSGANVLFDIGTLTVQNEVTVSSGFLTIEDNASLYQVQAVANAPGVYSGGNSGSITSRRVSEPMYKFDYTYWSSPVNPQNLLAVSPTSPQNLFLTYNDVSSAWQYIASPGTTTMTVGKGYIIRAPLNYPVSPALPLPYTASFSGVPNNGTFTIPISGGANQMNLLGNPYPSALFASDFITGNTNVNGTLYFWTHNTPLNASLQYTASDYAMFNLVGGTLPAPTTGAGTSNLTAPSGYIASGQGFFVKGLANSTATFSNSMRRAGNNTQFYRLNTPHQQGTTLERHRYWVDITNSQGAFKQVLIGYIEGATLGLDRLFDGDMVDVGNAINLYTAVENTKLSIQGRPLPFDVADTLPLCYKSTINGTYSIRLSLYDGLFTTQHVYLEDKLLNLIHDLRVAPYSFTTLIGTFEDRFVLRYTVSALGTTDPVFTENSVIVYKNDQGLYIDSGAVNMATVSIFDIRGRLLATQKQVNRTTTVFTTLPTTNQVLLVRIEAEDGAIVTKKVVY